MKTSSALESRLDNIVYRMGFAPSRPAARQLVMHGHFTVNGQKVDIPSYLVRGRCDRRREGSRNVAMIKESVQAAASRGVPAWLELDAEAMTGTVKGLPSSRSDRRASSGTPHRRALLPLVHA